MSNLKMHAKLVFPQKPLDKNYRARCSCGDGRNFYYMKTTCERWTDMHIDRGHDVTVYETDAEPLTRVVVKKNLRRQGSHFVRT